MSEVINIDAVETIAEGTATQEVKPYTFRKLSADDMFLMFNIISKIGIREFRACFEDETIGKLLKKFTTKTEEEESNDEAALYTLATVALLPAIDIILGNLSKCKEDMLTLLSQVSGMKVKEIREDAILFMEMVVDFLHKPEFPDFMRVVSKLFK